jgi:hypothetical protein
MIKAVPSDQADQPGTQRATLAGRLSAHQASASEMAAGLFLVNDVLEDETG